MTPDVVVDIGNSRIKWGRWNAATAEMAMVSLSGDDAREWDEQARRWELGKSPTWAVAGVRPEWEKHFAEWVRARGNCVLSMTHEHIPIAIDVETPGAVGIDRLLNAVAANGSKPRNSLAVVISVGTAVTVDLVRADGSFAGGTIFPGPRLMAASLHQMTAKLPALDLDSVECGHDPPCTNTVDAIRTGICYAIVGGIKQLIDVMVGNDRFRTSIFMTGGAFGVLVEFDFGYVEDLVFRPTLTLEGLRLAAESLP